MKGKIIVIELADSYHYDKIDCFKNNKMRTNENINDEILNKVKKILLVE